MNSGNGDLMLSWAKPQVFDFHQTSLDKQEYKDLCTIHVFIAKINNHLFKIHAALLKKSVLEASPQTIAPIKGIIWGTLTPYVAALLLWIETVVEGKYSLNRSDFKNVGFHIEKIRESAEKLDTLYEQQIYNQPTAPNEYTRVKQDFTAVMETLEKLDTLIMKKQQ